MAHSNVADPQPLPPTRIVLLPIRNAGTGAWHGRYRVTLDGETIVSSSRDPDHDAARALLARGITGPFETVGENGTVRMRYKDIAEAARWRIVEEDHRGLRRVKYRPWGGLVAPPHAAAPSGATALPDARYGGPSHPEPAVYHEAVSEQEAA